MKEFSQAAAAVQAPIQECAAISGSDDAAQIARAGWGHLEYAPLHVWRPATASVYREYVVEFINDAPIGPGEEDYYNNPTYRDETRREFKKISVPYGAWYLAYQRIPQDDEQARRQGTGLYAMQGFRCAIQMRDFPAARRYWALALRANPESTATYAQMALQSLFQVYFLSAKNDSGPEYLNLPQDIRSDVWNAVGQHYSGRSMEQIENAARAGTLSKIFSQADLILPPLSVLYCPAFYPDFDPIPITRDYDLTPRFPVYLLRYATERATGTAGKSGKGR